MKILDSGHKDKSVEIEKEEKLNKLVELFNSTWMAMAI